MEREGVPMVVSYRIHWGVDINVNTNVNRNGSTAVCDVNAATPMDINSYAVNMLASGGTVTYGNFINRQSATMSIQLQVVNPGDGVTYKNGFFGIAYIPAGLYRLGTLTITGTSGTPKIDFVDLANGSVDFTSFGTPCRGQFDDNTYKLDGPNTQGLQVIADWFDADGVAAGGGPVNTPPTVTPPGNKTTNELVNLAFPVVASDPDAGQTLTYSLTLGSPAATGATINSATGAFSWTPTEVQGPGIYPVTVTATDNATPTPGSGSASFSITVNEVNTAPVVTSPGNRVVDELANLAFTVTATDGDLPAQTITWTLTMGTPAATGATIGATTGAFSWTPTEVQGPGVYPVTITATDNATPTPGSGTAAITITVNEVNLPPSVTNPGNKTTAELANLAFTVVATDPDLPPQTLTFSLTLGSPAATGATIGATTGAFSWTPTEVQGPGTYP